MASTGQNELFHLNRGACYGQSPVESELKAPYGGRNADVGGYTQLAGVGIQADGQIVADGVICRIQGERSDPQNQCNKPSKA